MTTQKQFHTIDPLILETLNLNEQRMNHILNIIHGREDKFHHPKTQRKSYKKSLSKNRSIPNINEDQSLLPPILLTNKNNKEKYKTIQKSDVKPQIKNSFKKSIEKQPFNEQLQKDRSIQKVSQTQKSEKRYKAKTKSAIKMKQQTTIAEDKRVIDEHIQKFQQYKKQLMMKDYMLNKLKRSKSQQINPKDIYRLQIQSIVAELTSVEDIQEAQKRMKRLKRRYKHLNTFDRSYYSKLNQNDLLNLK